MQIKDATPADIREHIGGCGTCRADPVLALRLDEFNAQDDPCERRFLAGQIDERVGDLHGQFI